MPTQSRPSQVDDGTIVRGRRRIEPPQAAAIIYMLPFDRAAQVVVVRAWQQTADSPVEYWHVVAEMDDRYEVVLEALRGLIERGEPLSLWIGSRRVRIEVERMAAAFPQLNLTVMPAHMARLAAAASEYAATIAENEELRHPDNGHTGDGGKKARRLLEVATDASARLHHNGVGIAFFAETGRAQYAFLADTANVVVGELSAMLMAAKAYPKRAVRIVTDSREALSLVRDPRRTRNGLAHSVAHELHQLVEQRRIEVGWAPRNSTPLLEGADRLSRLARRARQFGLEDSESQVLVEQIVAEMFAALDRDD